MILNIQMINAEFRKFYEEEGKEGISFLQQLYDKYLLDRKKKSLAH